MLCGGLLLQNQRLSGKKQESHLTGKAVGHRDKWVEGTWQLGLVLFSKENIVTRISIACFKDIAYSSIPLFVRNFL